MQNPPEAGFCLRILGRCVFSALKALEGVLAHRQNRQADRLCAAKRLSRDEARHIAASRSVQSVLAITGGLRAFQATYTTGKSLCHGCVTRGTENTSLMGDYHVASKATFKSKAQ